MRRACVGMDVVLSQWSGSNRGGYKIVQSNSRASVNLDGVFNIISYDIVPKLQDLLLASKFQVVIADESHFLKNAHAKRTCASLPILQRAQYTVLLSGTPALSRPIELFKQLEALYPEVYKNVHEYGDRYCKGGIFGIYQGASNHEELHNLMKATVMIRRLKKDVLAELPLKRRQQVLMRLCLCNHIHIYIFSQSVYSYILVCLRILHYFYLTFSFCSRSISAFLLQLCTHPTKFLFACFITSMHHVQ
ncbi:Chromatin remodelling complex ATPase chain isw-1 [Dorcoceras hygrometricum]|uniref:Chromatin remodelling complex ATPase chain isw-1 n=1 Tax=Dorcoceras hygrometricum TaxID=472368 RepID=A0A2Z7C7G6_9LAMI|nr:Chromatin remodelling complex ATPase chain isw-1 [Dorcoceras hygrometricum]